MSAASAKIVAPVALPLEGGSTPGPVAAPTPTKREHALDALRGMAIVLAMVEHYIAFLQVWYTGYFREMRLLDSSFALFKPRIGTVLAMDDGLHHLAVWFIPWLTQLYVFLAAANLARRPRAAFARVYPRKLQLFAVLFVAFTAEQMILARDAGEMLLFGPTQLWCVLLALIATLYRYVGVWPVAALFAAAWTRFLLPVHALERGIQEWARGAIHPSVFIDAWADVFLPAATAGFLFMIVTRKWPRAWIPLTGAALGAILVYKLTRPAFDVPRDRIFATEHLVTSWASGQAAVLGMLVLTTVAATMIDRTRWSRPVPLLSWAGRQILPLYLVHKIYFVFFWMPLRDLVATGVGQAPELTVYEVLPAVASCLVFLWVGQKARLFDLLAERAHG